MEIMQAGERVEEAIAARRADVDGTMLKVGRPAAQSRAERWVGASAARPLPAITPSCLHSFLGARLSAPSRSSWPGA